MTKSLIALSLFAASVALAAPAAAAANLNAAQTGNYTYTEIYQRGGKTVVISRAIDPAKAAQMQADTHAVWDTWRRGAGRPGKAMAACVRAMDGVANSAAVAQAGSNNAAGVAQRGSGSSVALSQAGDANAGYLIQFGNDQTAAAAQSGSNNILLATQSCR